MDFFALLLESIVDELIEKFEFIANPIVKGIVQIVFMILFCAVIIGVGFLFVYILKKIKNP